MPSRIIPVRPGARSAEGRPRSSAFASDRPASTASRVHVAPGLLGHVAAAPDRRSTPPTRRTDTVEAITVALNHLRGAGLEVVESGRGEPWPSVDDPTAIAQNRDWLVTDDPANCTASRPGLITILVAPGTDPPGPARIRRCDRRVRSLMAAVLEILATEAEEPN